MYPVQQQQQQVNTVSGNGMQQPPPPPPAPRYYGYPGRPRVLLTLDEKSRRQTLAFGIVLVVFGVLIGTLVSICMGFERYWVAYGYAATILYILCGSFGIWAGKQNNPCAVRTFMVLSIQAAVWSLVLIIVSIVSAAISNTDQGRVTESIVLEILLIILAFVGGALCLVISIFFCKASCRAQQEAISRLNHMGYSPCMGQAVVSYGGRIETTPQQQQPYPGMMPAPQMMPTGAPMGPPAYNTHQQYPQNWTSPPNYDNIAANYNNDKM